MNELRELVQLAVQMIGVTGLVVGPIWLMLELKERLANYRLRRRSRLPVWKRGY